jgi:hypothetical protein
MVTIYIYGMHEFVLTRERKKKVDKGSFFYLLYVYRLFVFVFFVSSFSMWCQIDIARAQLYIV